MRYLIIDNSSGYIVGDTIDAADKVYRIDDPISASKRLCGMPLVRVSWLGPHEHGFRVYLANNDFVTAIPDRRHAHMIETIEQECACVASLKIAIS